MAVECNALNDIIEFTREIKDGKGETLYGVEIAKVILNNDTFIKQTYKCRNEILKKCTHIHSTKQSRYNSSLFVDHCQFPDCKSCDELDSHHIVYQSSKKASQMNVHGSGNIVILCKKHHNEVHSDKLVIKKWKNTTKGKVLDYVYKNN